MAHDHSVEHRVVFKRELVLAQFAEALVTVDRDRAGRLGQVSTQYLHEGRLAAAVCADQAITVAVAELDRDVLEQGLGPNCMVILAVEIKRRFQKII